MNEKLKIRNEFDRARRNLFEGAHQYLFHGECKNEREYAAGVVSAINAMNALQSSVEEIFEGN